MVEEEAEIGPFTEGMGLDEVMGLILFKEFGFEVFLDVRDFGS